MLGFPLEETAQTTYFDGETNRLWLPTGAPVSNLVLSAHNTITGAYDPINALYLRHSGTSEVYTSLSLPRGFQSVRATYTTGWTAATLPADLKQALIDLVGLKLQAVTNFSSNPDDPAGDGSGAATGALKRVSSGAFSEEYGSTGSEVMWKAKATQLSRRIRGPSLRGPGALLSAMIPFRKVVDTPELDLQNPKVNFAEVVPGGTGHVRSGGA